MDQKIYVDQMFYKEAVRRLGYRVADWTFRTSPSLFIKSDGHRGMGRLNGDGGLTLEAAVIGFIMFSLPKESEYWAYINNAARP